MTDPPEQARPYGSPPPDDAAAHPPYVYNPYGNVAYPSSYPVPPAGLGPDAPAPAVRRPGSVHLALALLLVSALPYLFVGLLALVGAGAVVAELPPELVAQLQQVGDPTQLLQTAVTLLLVVAVAFVLLAVLAWTGRRWARSLLAAMITGFVLLFLASFATSGGIPVDGGSLVLGLLPVALAVVGVVLLFGSAARAWFDRPRR